MLAFILLLAMIGTIIISINDTSDESYLLSSSVFYNLKLTKFSNYFINLFNDKTLFLALYVPSIIYTYHMCVKDTYTLIFFLVLVCMTFFTTYFIFTNQKKERIPFFSTLKSIFIFFVQNKMFMAFFYPCFLLVFWCTKGLGYN